MPSTLALGSKGEEVKELQRQLTSLGYGSYLDPHGVDGSFGESTQKAVDAFQQSVGLSERQSGAEAKVGSTCIFLGGPVYKASTDPDSAVAARRKRAVCTLTIKTDMKRRHPLHLIYQPGNDKVYGWCNTKDVEFSGAICGPLTWEALRKALNPDPPEILKETKVPEAEAPLDLSSDSGMFIMNLVTGSTINIEYKPDDVSDSVSVQFEDETPRGRSVGYTGYNNTTNRVVSVVVKLHADLLPEGKDLEQMVNLFKALEYPEYRSGVVVPPNCYVNLYRGIRFAALCTQVDVTWHGDIKNNMYTHADVNLSFRNTVDTPYTATIVETGGNGSNG